MSRFSRKWRRSMAARKKPISVVQPAAVSLDTTAFSPAAQESIEKDMCLLQSALAGDRVIITRDDALSKALSGTDEGAKLVKSITWINPISDGAEALASL